MGRFGMKREALVLACCSDIAGKVRGKAFPQADFENRLKRGIGWTPTNVQITCFDNIAESPFGALGDLVLIPDELTRVIADFQDGLGPEQFVLGDILQTTGTSWECCTRSILKAALERLKSVAGVELCGAFEHEFHFKGGACPIGSAYTSAGFRTEREFAEVLVAMLRDAGLKPDTVMKEYALDQYEVTVAPAQGVSCADHAVILRELVRVTAERLNREVSFTPIRTPGGVGNGVHIHMSFRGEAGQPVTYDPDRKHGLGEMAGRFIAGVLKYLDRIVAITAPSVISYARLTPHRWSAAFNNLGFRDREASVRICPLSDLSDIDKASQYNFEFRAADAAASPYLALAAIVHAGAQGIEESLDCPEATQEDLSLLSASDLEKRGYIKLPQSLEEALARFANDKTVVGWFPQGFADIYVKHKQGEMEALKGKTESEICAAYETAY
jgi:glutamine synthetase